MTTKHLNVLHVYKTYYPEQHGGLEETIRQICHATSPLGIENRVYTLCPPGQPHMLTRPEANVIRFPRNIEIASCGMSLRALLAFRQHAKWADVVHYHFPWPFADLMHLFGDVRCPTLVTYHSDIVRQRRLFVLYAPLMKRFMENISHIVSTSPNYLRSSPVLQQYAKKTTVIPIGLDPQTFGAPDPQTIENIKERYGSNFFFFIGVLRYYKGLNVLLDAVAGTQLPVVIAGVGPLESELKEKTRQLGLQNVQFTGHVSDAEKAALYSQARAVVFPSLMRSEAFGVTLVEGAMHGKPLISTELGTGTSYVNAHNETGLVVTPDDPQALRRAMQTLHTDDIACNRMGIAARTRFERLFTAERMGQRYVELYQDLLDRERC